MDNQVFLSFLLSIRIYSIPSFQIQLADSFVVVRDKAKALHEFLHDDDRIHEEREKARVTAAKFSESISSDNYYSRGGGYGNSGGGGGGGYGGNSGGYGGSSGGGYGRGKFFLSYLCE